MKNLTKDEILDKLEDILVNFVGTGVGMLPNDISSFIDEGLRHFGRDDNFFYRLSHIQDYYVLNEWDGDPKNDFPHYVDRPYPLSERSTRNELKYGLIGLAIGGAYWLLTKEADTSYLITAISTGAIADAALRRFNRKSERARIIPAYEEEFDEGYGGRRDHVYEVPYIHHCPGTLILEVPYQIVKNTLKVLIGKLQFRNPG